jgi:hypothetical protein
MNAPINSPLPLRFDENGDVDEAAEAQIFNQIADKGVKDLVIFSHGWNNDEGAATSLYGRWSDLLAAQLGPGRSIGFIGVRWPAQLWRDEPIPDFDPAPRGPGGGAAAVEETPTVVADGPTLTPAQLQDLKVLFPEGAEELDEIATLLAAEPNERRASKMFAAMRKFSDKVQAGFNDGEDSASKRPGMLRRGSAAEDVFEAFSDALSDTGVEFAADGDGAAGLGDAIGKLWNGAKEALRQLTYWKMKNRAGVVGQNGVGPLIGRLTAKFPDMRIHLVGHSFGARVVSFALAGMPASGQPSPVKSVTLLEGAFSRFAFTDQLPFNSARKRGALAGKLARIDGPLTVCFSSHDSALSVMYPLASAAAGDDSAGADDPLFRFRAIGSLGAFEAPTQPIGPVKTAYPFASGAILNVDSSDIVAAGSPPGGAHSDIFHPELAWIVASAAKLTA